MKRLLFISTLLIAFTLTANAQQFQIGSDAVQVGVSSIEGDQSAFLNVGYDHTLKGLLTARFSLSGGVMQSSSETTVYNEINETYRSSGVSQRSLLGFVQPSVMAGFKIPVADMNLGIYSGYQTTINEHINHRFVPLSVHISFSR